MADNNMNKNQSGNDRNQTMQHEQAKASVSGKDNQSSPSGEFDKNRQDKSAIGGGENRSQTGEPGRGRDEIKQGQTTGQAGSNRETESSGSTNR